MTCEVRRREGFHSIHSSASVSITKPPRFFPPFFSSHCWFSNMRVLTMLTHGVRSFAPYTSSSVIKHKSISPSSCFLVLLSSKLSASQLSSDVMFAIFVSQISDIAKPCQTTHSFLSHYLDCPLPILPSTFCEYCICFWYSLSLFLLFSPPFAVVSPPLSFSVFLFP